MMLREKEEDKKKNNGGNSIINKSKQPLRNIIPWLRMYAILYSSWNSCYVVPKLQSTLHTSTHIWCDSIFAVLKNPQYSKSAILKMCVFAESPNTFTDVLHAFWIMILKFRQLYLSENKITFTANIFYTYLTVNNYHIYRNIWINDADP